MVQLVTQGIKVSVSTAFEDVFYGHQKRQYAFSYVVTIENNSDSEIQLLSRYWLIKDALNTTEIVQGKGVIGRQPIILPREKHTYNSGCLLMAPIGSMQGHYNIVSSNKTLKIGIPLFKLNAPFVLN
ncbi:MAG: Co2+/Mg2+ efflux protein ApaG [Bacteroidetes bacterium]|nr:Co2+/Mg2+ efflux protein ApaG [Bacteroidota bacterium]